MNGIFIASLIAFVVVNQVRWSACGDGEDEMMRQRREVSDEPKDTSEKQTILEKYISQIPGIRPLTEEQQRVLISEMGFDLGSPPVQFLMDQLKLKSDEKPSGEK